ncbi:MAG TPA: aminopeptidase P family N-terminal domain-containing protein [Solirubrobacteraceae bacterium]|nr:aminopeptidase P family N-terminal domain-containing protein [Solirubrobacteraceae bacterium]
MSADATRAQRLAAELDALGVDALLVDALVDIRYLSGFTGSNALVLAVAASAAARLGAHRFLSDFRHATQSAAQVPEAFAREIVTEDLLGELAQTLADAGGRLGFEEASRACTSPTCWGCVSRSWRW